MKCEAVRSRFLLISLLVFVCDRYLLFHRLVRYYNCVPFAGCVFLGPSKMCQPRVKTFEELPLEMHPQKPPQVSSLSS